MSKFNTNFAGLNGFVWWVGVIADIADPLEIGRCRVRIHGWHTDDKSLIPDTDLPWGHPMLSINKTTHSLAPNDWVMGFFADGESGQFPIIMGFLPGIANKTQ
jgi:hypothetical protein